MPLKQSNKVIVFGENDSTRLASLKEDGSINRVPEAKIPYRFRGHTKLVGQPPREVG